MLLHSYWFNEMTSKLLNLPIERMTTLAKSWGGVPQILLRFLDNGMHDDDIEWEYRYAAKQAVQRCRVMISSTVEMNVVVEALSKFYFCRPKKTRTRIVRAHACAEVPTPTLRRLLGEALQRQDNTIKLDFFCALRQSSETRSTAGYIYESWFHVYLSAAKTIQCHWIQGLDGVSSLTGTSTLINATWAAIKVAEPPYYWVAPKNFPGVDSALVLDNAIYAFQVTISSRHKTPLDGLRTLREHLPAKLKNVSWKVVFVGDNDSAIAAVARQWVDRLFFPTNQQRVTVGWSKVDPVMEDVPYRVWRLVNL